MIKKVIKELLADWKAMLFCLIVMFIIMLGISKFQFDYSEAEFCGMDVFSLSSRFMASCVFIICSFLSITLNKGNFKPQRVVLSQKISSVWNYTIIKTIIISLVMSVFIFMITFLCSIIGFSDFFNWNSENSFFYHLMGRIVEDINYPILFITYFCQAFLGICTAAIAPMLTFWLFKSFVAGAAAITVLILAGGASGAEFIYGRNIFYDKIINGIDIRYHFIFPAIVLVILMVAGSLKTKRDFI